MPQKSNRSRFAFFEINGRRIPVYITTDVMLFGISDFLTASGVGRVSNGHTLKTVPGSSQKVYVPKIRRVNGREIQCQVPIFMAPHKRIAALAEHYESPIGRNLARELLEFARRQRAAEPFPPQTKFRKRGEKVAPAPIKIMPSSAAIEPAQVELANDRMIDRDVSQWHAAPAGTGKTTIFARIGRFLNMKLF